MKLTKIKIEQMANEIMAFLKENDLDMDVNIYFNNKRMNSDGVEDNISPKDYFEYAADNHILSMSFEGGLYRLISYDGGKLLNEFNAIFNKYGVYYDIGNAWNSSCYLINDDVEVEYTYYQSKPEPIRIWTLEDENIPKELRAIVIAWQQFQDKVGDVGSCVCGAGFEFKYNGQTYFMTPCSKYQGSISWETDKYTIEKMLEQIGCTDIRYDWGVMD